MSVPPARRPAPRPVMDEDGLQFNVIDLCKRMGLLHYHTHDSRRSVAGFPDLVIVGRRGVLFRELKTDTGRVTPEQQVWLGKLAQAGEDAGVWRPTDWPNRVASELKDIR